MKIVIFAADFKPATGGIAEYTHQLAKHLQVAGNQVLVLARDADGATAFDRENFYQVKRVLSLPQARSGFVARYRRLGQVVQAFEPDVILINALLSEAAVAHLLARRLKVPFGVFSHGQELYSYRDLARLRRSLRFKKSLIRELVLRKADLVVCNSRFTQGLLTQMGVEAEKITIIPPAVDVQALDGLLNEALVTRPMLPPEVTQHPVLLTLSRLVPRKGIDVVLQALPTVLEEVSDVLYLIAGDGPDRERLEQLCADLGLEEHVRFLGRITEEEKALFYHGADVFVMPNRSEPGGDVEGFGIVFLEANAHRKPVVAGHTGGAVDAVVHGVTGLLVDPEDTRQVSKAIVTLFTNSKYAEQLGRQGRQRVEEELTWAKSSRKLHRQLTAIVAQ